MKIFEIVREANEYERGKAIATRILSPSQWIKPDPDGAYEKGKAFTSKLMSPSQWFKSDKSNSDSVEKSKEKPAPATTVNLNSVKRILNSILRGEPRYQEDVRILSQLRSKIKSGSIEVSVNADQLSQALKTIINNDQLSDDQNKLIKSFSDSI